MSQKEERIVIDEFAKHLSSGRNINLCITSYPEDDKNIPDSEKIDAIAESDGVKIALEHTSIDTYPEQRLDNARFMEVIGGSLKEELDGRFDGGIRLTVNCRVIKRRLDWAVLKEVLKEWLIEKVPSLPNGFTRHNVPDIPFEICIHKKNVGNSFFLVSRFDPEDDTLPERLRDSIKKKTKKLIPYKQKAYDIYLLIESNDIALMDVNLMVESVREALRGYQGTLPDEIWCAETLISDNHFRFCCAWPIEKQA